VIKNAFGGEDPIDIGALGRDLQFLR
jgi:hypothetical protein